MPLGESSGHFRIEPGKALLGIGLAGSQGLQILVAQAQLAGAEDLRMAGEDLLGQGRARSRQADDEHRPLRLQAEAAHPLEERRREGGDHVRDETGVLGRIVALAAFPPVGQGQGVGLTKVLGGLGVLALASRTWARPKCRAERSAPVRYGSASRDCIASRSASGSLLRRIVASCA